MGSRKNVSQVVGGIIVIALILGIGGLAAADPVVSNVTAAQRNDGSGLVDVYYNLSGVQNTAMIYLTFSNDNGVNWNVLPMQALLSGDVGPTIVNGNNKHIVWDAARDRGEAYWPQMRARVTARETGQTLTVTLPGGVPLELVRIPTGYFQMGSPYYIESNEGPLHTVNINYEFHIGKFEITQAQWYAVMGSVPNPIGTNYPAGGISWNDCQTFFTALNALGIGTFRLPTEAEWEYACRAGTNTRWHCGDTTAALTDYAWYDKNSPTEVGTKLPNPWGLYDMHGNVWEWVEDWYHDTYTDAPADGSAWVDPVGTARVLRGGAYTNTDRYCRSAYRLDWSSDSRALSFGFRIVRTN